MPKGLVNESSLNSIGTAINVLNGTEGTYMPSEMGEAIIDAIPTETANGNPIHITDAAACHAESCVTTLEPVQDLHGYDKPWPAGGGKNLFNKNAVEIGLINANGTVNSTPTNWRASEFINVDGLSNVYISGVSNSAASSNGGAWYDNSKNFISYFTMSSVISDGNLSVPANAVYVRFSVIESNINTAQLEAGSIATSYAPYSNICPITGHTGVELTRMGKNLLNIMSYAEWKLTYYEVNSDVLTLLRQDSLPWNEVGRPVLTLSAGTYSISTSNTSTIQVYNITTDTEITRGLNPTFTLAENATIGIKIFSDSYPFVAGQVMCELSNTATTYEPYSSETHSITFPQAQSPVYGCRVDWVNGVLRVTDANVDLGTLNWRLAAKSGFYADNNIGAAKKDGKTIMCDRYKTANNASSIQNVEKNSIAGSSVQSNNRVYITDTSYESLQDFKTAMDGVIAVYELATPIEITLTPEVITLLKGENNIWTDSGTSEIEYTVDLQSYIQKLIDEASAQASALSVSPLSLGRSTAVSTDGEGEEAEKLPVDEVESVDEADEVGGEPVEEDAELPVEEDTEAEPIESEIWVKDPDVEEVIYKPIDVTEPDTLEKEGGDTV